MNIEATQMTKQTANGTFGNLNKAHARHSFKKTPANQTVRFIRLEAGCTVYASNVFVRSATPDSEFTIGIETTHSEEQGGTYIFGKAKASANGIGSGGTSVGVASHYKHPVFITVTNLTDNADAEAILTVDYVYDGVS